MFVIVKYQLVPKALLLIVLILSAFALNPPSAYCSTQAQVAAFVASLTAKPGCKIMTKDDTQNGQQVIQVIQNCGSAIKVSREIKLVNEVPIRSFPGYPDVIVTICFQYTDTYCDGRTEITTSARERYGYAKFPECGLAAYCSYWYSFYSYPKFYFLIPNGDCTPYEEVIATFNVNCASGDPYCSAGPVPDTVPDCY